MRARAVSALLVAAAVAVASSLAASPAAAQALPEPVGPWDGKNPFRCKLQKVGQGVDYPDPGADPFCVEYDKTALNVTEAGLLEFALLEPVRVGRALDKCFYFQRDHWTGWLIQGEGPELFNWNGDYFFDVARGVGGVSVRNFRLAGIPMDMTPFVPEEYRPYFDPGGGGGVRVLFEFNPPYPPCAERIDTPEKRAEIYRDEPRPRSCRSPGGRFTGPRAGGVKLGKGRAATRKRMGKPTGRSGGADRWCLEGGGRLGALYSGGRVAAALSSARGHEQRGVGPGDTVKKARRNMRLREIGRSGKTRLAEHRGGANRRLFVGVRQGRVRWLAIADPGRVSGRPAALRALRALG